MYLVLDLLWPSIDAVSSLAGIGYEGKPRMNFPEARGLRRGKPRGIFPNG